MAEVRKAHRQLTAALPQPSVLYYSLKANPHPAVLRQLAALGCRAEVSSPGELHAALHAGFRPGEVLYTGPGKRDADISGALHAGVAEFSVDSPVALRQLAGIARRHDVRPRALLRVNQPLPPEGAGLAMTGGPSQFGADLAWIRERPEQFQGDAHARVRGLHLYMGSNLTSRSALLATFSYALDTARQVREALRRDLPVTDLGGGFGAPYARPGPLGDFGGLREPLRRLLDDRRPGWRSPHRRVAFESGRYLTAACGRLVTRVLDVKVSHGRRVVVVDSGVHHLGGMSGLSREHEIEPVLRTTGSRPPHPGPTLVAGRLCHPRDRWAIGTSLPEVVEGDLLAVENVGAYGLHASLTLFHAHPMPLEIVVDGGRELERSRIGVHRERC
ncbi:type III PLP-dependent enzyme [Streptomyces sp. NPDC017940]|uniref:type III PLP-dependent enzyme n=1 Tax=Streptomyces sp. NPDC017940 TaxID=3365017 RepID=UPI0037A1D0F8